MITESINETRGVSSACFALLHLVSIFTSSIQAIQKILHPAMFRYRVECFACTISFRILYEHDLDLQFVTSIASC